MRTALWSLAFLAGNVHAMPGGIKRDTPAGYAGSTPSKIPSGSASTPSGTPSGLASTPSGIPSGPGVYAPSAGVESTTDVYTSPVGAHTPPAYVPHKGGLPHKKGPHHKGKGHHKGGPPHEGPHKGGPPHEGPHKGGPPHEGPHKGGPPHYGGKGGEGEHTWPATTCKEVTTVFTTVIPITTTAAHHGTTVTRVHDTTSTITSTYTTTITYGYGPAPVETTPVPTYSGSAPGYSSESGVGGGIWTTIKWGSTHLSFTIPEYTATSSAPSELSTPSSPVMPSSSGESSVGGGVWTTIKWGTTHLSFTIPEYTKTSLSSYEQSTPSVSGSLPLSTPSFSGSLPLSTPSFPGSLPPSTPSFPGSLPPSGSVPPSTPSFPGSLPPSTPSFPGSLPPSTPSFPGSLPPSTPSFSGSLPPSTPSFPGSLPPSGSVPPSTPSFPGSLPPSTPSFSGSLRPSTPSFPGSLPPSTPSVAPSMPPKKTSTTSTSTTSTSTCTKPTPTLLNDCIPCQGQPGIDPLQFCGYTVNDNSYEVTPKTCATKYFDFTITNTTVNPDGIERLGLLINGQMPGPKIEANWGDTIVVRVTNNMQNNGTSIHFHGIRQFFTNEMDGVPSITQCPIAPGDTMTYTFTANNYGTSWYHSHFALQTYEGVFGPMVIHGPSSLPYDDEETILIQDWSHDTVDSKYATAQDVVLGGPQTLDNGLINGKGVLGSGSNSTGSYFQMNVVSGLTYRIRLVNTAIQSSFKFHIDGHKFKVIAADFVPIIPYEADIISINIGQRYDLIMTADQPIANYWMRSDNQQPCAQLKQPNTLGMVSYVGALGTPTTTSKNYTAECVDEPYASLVPVVPLNAGVATSDNDYINKTVVIGPNGGTPNLFKWTLSGTTFQSQWGQPTLQQIVENGTAPTFSGDLAINVPNLKEWVYVVIDSPVPLPHPIHLHGHDFLILAQGQGLYNSNVTLNTINPPRRDVALMPWDPVNVSGGHLVLAFETDNPGVWLMHCHIGWHTSMGFALQIIENMEGINDTVTDSCAMEDTCKNWATYAADFDIHVEDSGV